MLKNENPALRLYIIGKSNLVDQELKNNGSIVFTGILPRKEVIALILQAKFYISTTRIENSYNAASEGIYLVPESYISDIGPHIELLNGINHEVLEIGDRKIKSLHVKHKDLSTKNLKLWREIIEEKHLKIFDLLNQFENKKYK
jgi:hypothetical protein